VFNEVVRGCDRLLLLPVYDAGGTADRSVNSDALAALVPRSETVADMEAAYRICAENFGRYSAFVTAGARDGALPGLARRLARLEPEAET
jgi:UDP-N-acetylmuramate-alanine ligase